jgi:hypothetical protein
MTSRPTIDVVVPCYNYGRYLRRCVDSVLAQPDLAARVLIIDDCSSDDTPEIGQSLARDDSRVEYRRHVTNQGHIRTYNEGLLGWVTADYCLLLSADDYLVAGALAHPLRLMQAHPEVALAYGMALLVSDGAPPAEALSAVTRVESRVVDGRAFLQHICDTAENPVPTPAAVVRTSVQRAIGGYDASLPHTGDLEMWMRCALKGDVGVLNVPVACYRRHDDNMTHAYKVGALGDLREYVAAFESVFVRHAAAWPDGASLLAAGRRRIALQAFWAGVEALERGSETAAVECFQFARRTSPSLRWSGQWLRARLRLMIGCQAYDAMAGPLRRLLSARPGPEAAACRAAPSRVIGWWPSTGQVDEAGMLLREGLQ